MPTATFVKHVMDSTLSPAQTLTRAEVKDIAGEGSVTIIVHDKVYDVSRYLEDHPGGSAILRGVAGSDATAAFDDVGHSDDARQLLERFCIGRLAEAERQKTTIRSVFTSKKLESTHEGNHNRFEAALRALLFSQTFAQNLLTFASGLLALKLLWPGLMAWDALVTHLGYVPEFWRGIAIASLGSGACFWVVGYQFSKTIVMTKGFRMYPPIMKPTKTLNGPRILAQYRPAGAVGPTTFSPVKLIAKVKTAPDTYSITLRTVDPSDRPIAIPAGQHIQLRAQLGRLQVTRSYTPVSSRAANGYTTIDLAIRVYQDGKLGNYLANMQLDETVECRGPLGSFNGYHRFLCSEIGAIAGGSGITPLYGLVRQICENDSDDTVVRLLYANTTAEKIMLRPQLDELARRYPKKFQLHYFLNTVSAEEPVGGSSELGDASIVRNVHAGRITMSHIQELLPAISQDSKYLLCGPEGLVEQMRRNLVAMGAVEPQLVGHVTDQVFLF